MHVAVKLQNTGDKRKIIQGSSSRAMGGTDNIK